MAAVATAGAKGVSPGDHLLPLGVKPIHYDLTVRTDLEKLEYDGCVAIHLDVQNDTSKLIFNSSELEISNIEVMHNHSMNTKDKPVSLVLDPDSERATVELPSKLHKGSTAVVQIKFRGPLTGSMTGYYRSSWKNEGKEQYYSLTQFQPTSARRAFPCWDEPLLKATFSIALISRVNLINLSNMDVISEEAYSSEDGSDQPWKITRFAKTPPMSTYLVAYANGPFEHLEDCYVSPLSGKTIPLRIYATKDNISQVQFALDVKKQVLPLYERFFDVEYPLPKLDTLIANDFDLGAMENWGLIMGRTSAFCLDSTKVALQAQKNVAAMQSHETAHMWFGNITTMAWWDNLYLNEGFASLVGEVIALDKLFPEWTVRAEFMNTHFNRALGLDAKLSSHPVEVDCPDVDKVMQIFDTMSYSKAASVLRMLLEYVGEEVFMRGVSMYLKKHLYANSISRDLWDAIGEAADSNVTDMMQTWVCETVFPVLTVQETVKSIIVRQDRFLESGRAKEKDNQIIWHVPLNLVCIGTDGQLEIDRTVILKDREMEILLDTSKAFKLNHDSSAFCRVLYPPERLSKIAQQATPLFSLNDRIGLVNDVFALASAGYTDVSVALDLVHHLGKGEEEFLVWQGMKDSLIALSSVWWEDDVIHDLFQKFRRGLYLPLVVKLGYDYKNNEPPNVKQLRTLAVGGALSAVDPDVILELRRRFCIGVEAGDDTMVPADLEFSIYVAGVRYGGRSEYDIVKNIFGNPRSPNARTAAIIALCNASTTELIEETLKFMLTDAKEQDFSTFIASLASNRRTTRKVATFVKEHFDEIYGRLSGNFQLNYVISCAFEKLTTEADARDIQEFFKGKDVSKFDLALQQALDTIYSNAALIERSTQDVKHYLENMKK